MKTLFFSIAVVTTVILYSAGFFVPQNHVQEDTSAGAGMVILTETEMASQIGGYGNWQQKQTRPPSGSFANCAKRPCPTGKRERIFGHYACYPCEPNQTSWTRTVTTKVEISWCISFQDGRCKFRHYSRKYHYSCVAYVGDC